MAEQEAAAHWILRAVFYRIRFIAACALFAALIWGWPHLKRAFDHLTLAKGSRDPVVSLDTEYFCPMCPGVVSDWPAKCPVCFMALVRRPRGEAVVLPNGVVSRMQLTPYRVQLAGVRTVPATWEPLFREVVADGRLNGREVKCAVAATDMPYLAVGRAVSATLVGSPGNEETAGTVASIDNGSFVARLPETVRWPTGSLVRLRVKVPLAEFEPFRERANPPADNSAIRTVFFCADHPENLLESPGRCRIDGNELMRRRLSENERLGWWCPAHPRTTAVKAGAVCRDCGGMQLVPTIRSYAPPGRVLAVPRSAVVETGERKVVYVETMPGMFEGRIVELGAACGDHYPVIAGFEPNERVVATGAFLLDAEMRLNPSLAAAYFGASRNNDPRAAPPEAKKAGSGGALSPADRVLADRQRICPVTDEPLDSMGGPVRVDVQGRVVFICCAGCEKELRSDPKTYFAKLDAAGGRK